MKKFYLTCLIIIGAYNYLESQQNVLDNQYLINKFALSPAYAGYTQNTEAYFTYRKDWVGIEDAPQKDMININAMPYKNMGVGGAINSEKFGIYRNLSVLLSYAYKINISKSQSIRFGISSGIYNYNTQIDLSQFGTNEQIDPVVVKNQTQQITAFNAGLGILYNFKNLNIGLHVPRLLENNIKSKFNDNVTYTFKRQFILHGSYLFEINKDLEIEPVLITYSMSKTISNLPFYINFSVLAKYKKTVWLGLMSGNGKSIGIDLGGNYKRCVINYSYEFSGAGILANTSGSHEISIGYSFGDNKLKDIHSAKRPYYRWQN